MSPKGVIQLQNLPWWDLTPFWDSHAAFSSAGKIFLQLVKICLFVPPALWSPLHPLWPQRSLILSLPLVALQVITDSSWVSLSFSSISKLNPQFLHQILTWPGFEYVHCIHYHGHSPSNIPLLVNVILKFASQNWIQYSRCGLTSPEGSNTFFILEEGLYNQISGFKPVLFLPAMLPQAGYLSSLSLSLVLLISENIPCAGHHTRDAET